MWSKEGVRNGSRGMRVVSRGRLVTCASAAWRVIRGRGMRAGKVTLKVTLGNSWADFSYEYGASPLARGRQGIVAGYNAQAMVSPTDTKEGASGMLVTAVDVVEQAKETTGDEGADDVG